MHHLWNTEALHRHGASSCTKAEVSVGKFQVKRDSSFFPHPSCCATYLSEGIPFTHGDIGRRLERGQWALTIKSLSFIKKVTPLRPPALGPPWRQVLCIMIFLAAYLPTEEALMDGKVLWGKSTAMFVSLSSNVCSTLPAIHRRITCDQSLRTRKVWWLCHRHFHCELRPSQQAPIIYGAC